MELRLGGDPLLGCGREGLKFVRRDTCGIGLTKIGRPLKLWQKARA